MTTNDELSGQDDYGQAESDYIYIPPPYSYSELQESLKKNPPEQPNTNNERKLTDIESKDSYLKKMDSREQSCIEPGDDANKTRETKESTEKMGMDVSIDLVEQFKALSQEEQEQAMSWITSFREKAKPSALDQLKKDYIKFPENQKTTVDAVLAHLKPQLKDYVVRFGAKEDSIYLDDLREVEPLTTKMYQAFYRAHKKDSSSPLLSDLIPKQTEKTAKRLENYKFTETTTAKEYTQIESAKKYRRRMAINDSHNPHTV